MLNVVLYGGNGHQLSEEQIAKTHGVRLYGVCGAEAGAGTKRYKSLGEICRDEAVDLVSVCSPLRSEQGRDILELVRAGKHVYAEKPLATDNAELGEILTAARERGVFVGEMCGTAFDEPYYSVKKILSEGTLGEVVQAYMQKSYPYGEWRPQDERTDGGLIRQNAIHAVRVLMQTLSLGEAKSMHASETVKGNPHAGEYADGGLRMAASFLLTFANGAIATVNANYLNPKGNGMWGNERLIVFCTRGSVETDAGARTIRVSTDEGVQVLPWGEGKDYFGMVADHLNGETERPIPEEIEFLPTKTVNLLRERAEEAAK